MGYDPCGLRERILRVLQSRDPRHAAPAGYRRAAVLLPLYETATGPHLILTKRTDRVPTHKGQISLPGGGFHDADGDLRVTALRETEEEIWDRDGTPHTVYFYDYAGQTVWGLTARILKQFVELVGDREPRAPSEGRAHSL